MQKLPVYSEKFFPKGQGGANVTQAYWFEPTDEDLVKSHGGTGLFISLMGPDEFAGERTAKFMWDSYQEAYYYDGSSGVGAVGSDSSHSANSPSELLKKAVKEAQARLIELIQGEESISEQGVDLHMCAFVIHGKKAHFSLIGEPGVVLVRDGRVIRLADMLPRYDGSGYRDDVSIGSFDVKKKDIFIISTPQLVDSFFEVFEEEDLEEVISDWSRCVRELELFADNMSGNQYVWLVGYDVDPTRPKTLEDVVGVEDLESGEKAYSDKESRSLGKVAVAGGALVSGIAEGEKEGLQQDPYTPRGIWGESGKASDVTSSKEKPDQIQKPSVDTGITGKLKGFSSSATSSLKKEKVKTQISDLTEKTKDRLKSFSAKFGSFEAAKRNIGSKISSIKLRGGRRGKLFADGRGRSGGNRKVVMTAAIVVVVMVVVGGIALWYRGRQLNAEIERSIAEITADLETASNTWNVDKNKEESEKLLASIESELEDLRSKRLSDEQAQSVSDLEAEALVLSDDIKRITPLAESNGSIEILTDLYLKIGESVEPIDIARYGQDLYITDKDSHAVYRYTPGDDVAEKIADSEDVFENPSLISIGETFMFVYDENVGVVSLDVTQNEGQWEFKIRPELSARTLGAIEELGTFGDNVYLLKKDEARVLKSSPAGAGYTYPEEYFRHGGLDKSVDILIDGNIYVLSNSSDKIYKFYGGQQDAFALSGLDEPLSDLCCGATNSGDSSNLYVIDQGNERIVAIEKGTGDRHPGTGVMVQQFVYRGEHDEILKDVRDVVLDIDGNNMYVLDGTRILRVSLAHD